MSIEQPKKELDEYLKMKKLESITSKIDTLGWALLRWWGVIFRAFFICAIGTIGWLWIDPQSISDIPLSQLTLKQICGNIIAILIIIGCARWFFDFPEQSNDKNPEENPYVGWGQFGGFIVIVTVLVIYWANKT